MKAQKTNTKMLEVIKEAVEAVTKCDVLKKTRQVEYVQARSILFKIGRDNKQTFNALGKFLNKNHATVINSIKNFEHDIKYDLQFRDNYRAVKYILSSLDLKGCESASETLLGAYKMHNNNLVKDNLKLRAKVLQNDNLIKENEKLRAKMSTFTSEDKINKMLEGLPEDIIQYFIDNQLTSFVNIEKAILKREADKREADIKDKREFRRLAMHEEGGRDDDAKKYYYVNI